MYRDRRSRPSVWYERKRNFSDRLNDAMRRPWFDDETVDRWLLRGALTYAALSFIIPRFQDPNSDFDVRGKVTDTGKGGVEVEISDIDVARGAAGRLFLEGHRYNMSEDDPSGNFLGSSDAYSAEDEGGAIIDEIGQDIDPELVGVGECMRLIGEVVIVYVGSGDTRTSYPRPVYERAYIELCNVDQDER